MSAARLRAIPARSGEPNVEVEGVPYHSPYNPRREAHKFYTHFGLEKADVILHFGWGLGYAGAILVDRIKPSARVFIFEPDEELFKFSLTQLDNHMALQDRRFEFVIGRRVCQLLDTWTLEECQETDEFLWVEWPAAARLHPELATSLKASFRTRLRDRAANLLTHFQNGDRYFENVIGNFHYQADADAGRLFGRFRDVPCVIVSAGPSLDRNVRMLHGMEGRCFILAVDTALRPLLAAGITPHAVIIADPSELNAKHIVGVVPASTCLIAEQAVHESALRAASRRFLFALGLFPDSLFAKFGFMKSRLEVWGSVATAALDLACRMGTNPIIFAGQDCAYSWQRDYASHTIFDASSFHLEKAANARATDIWGRAVDTSENLVAYRDFFVRKIRQNRNIRFINATEGGILDREVEILSLKDALYQACDRPVDVFGMLQNWHRQSSYTADALAHFAAVLRERNDRCGCLSGFLELTAKKHLLERNREAIDQAILKGCEVLAKVLPNA